MIAKAAYVVSAALEIVIAIDAGKAPIRVARNDPTPICQTNRIPHLLNAL